MINKIVFVLFLLVLNTNAKEINIAVAANVSYAINDLIKEFNQRNPSIKVNVILGSSGKLYAQIRHGAPYDLFMSADMKFGIPIAAITISARLTSAARSLVLL